MAVNVNNLEAVGLERATEKLGECALWYHRTRNSKDNNGELYQFSTIDRMSSLGFGCRSSLLAQSMRIRGSTSTYERSMIR